MFAKLEIIGRKYLYTNLCNAYTTTQNTQIKQLLSYKNIHSF